MQEKETVIQERKSDIDKYVVTIKNKEQEIEHLRFQVEQLNRMCFGAKRERFINKTDPNQLEIFEKPTEEQVEEVIEKEKLSYERSKPKKKHSGREKLPDHLPVKEIILYYKKLCYSTIRRGAVEVRRKKIWKTLKDFCRQMRIVFMIIMDRKKGLKMPFVR